MRSSELAVELIFLLVRIICFIYTVLTGPLFVLHALFRRRKNPTLNQLAYSLSGLGEGPWRCIDLGENQPLVTTAFDGIDTLYESWQHAAKLHANGKCMGQRRVLGEFPGTDPITGKPIRKLKLGDYEWQTYSECASKVERLARALSKRAGVRRGAHIAFYCETRPEWMCTALAALREQAVIVTLYATLTREALDLALRESEPCCIVTSTDLLEEKLSRLTLPSSVAYIVTVNERQGSKGAKVGDNTKVKVLSLPQLLREENDAIVEERSSTKARPDDIVVVMYTSGTTGRPKGVMMTHSNLLGTIGGGTCRMGRDGMMCPGARLLTYLPLAHVLEFACEMAALFSGCELGYGSPYTLSKLSPRIHDCEGDLVTLQPKMMPAVPIILERLAKGIREKLALTCDLQAFVTVSSNRESRDTNREWTSHRDVKPVNMPFGTMLKSRLGEMIMAQKIAAYENGTPTPLIDAIVCRKLRTLVGGKLEMMMVGGASLNRATQTVIAALFNVYVATGYGLTETSSATCMSEPTLGIKRHGTVGSPLPCCDLLLRSWNEAGYTDDVLKAPVDSRSNGPCPRGELLVSGTNLFVGYFRNEEETKNAFLEISGRKWFATGDVVEVLTDGSLRMIDRRKDCFKLENGEYIAPGRIEAALLASSFVELICVIGNSTRNYLVGLLVPKRAALVKLAYDLGVLSDSHNQPNNPPAASDAQVTSNSIGKKANAAAKRQPVDENVDDEEWRRICEHEKVRCAILDDFARVGSTLGLPRVEIPTRVHICTEIWSSENGLLTDSLKLRRRNIESYYRSVIELLYASKII